MKTSMLIGVAAGSVIGAVATMAMHGDLSSRNMKRMGRKMTRQAHRMGIDL